MFFIWSYTIEAIDNIVGFVSKHESFCSKMLRINSEKEIYNWRFALFTVSPREIFPKASLWYESPLRASSAQRSSVAKRIWSSIERVCPFPNFLWHARKATQRAECGVSNEGAQSEWIMLFRERSWSTGSARTLLLVNKITTEKAQLIYRCRIRTLSYSTYN